MSANEADGFNDVKQSPAANTTTNNEEEAKAATSSAADKEKEDNSSRFECNICLDVAKDAVVSFCGHLFCWPCLHQWLDTRPNRQLCPVCKSAISKDRVIPLYGRGGDNSDPREKVPPRPQGQRSEESPQGGFPGMFQWGGDNGHGGVQFSLGIGVFPIQFFASFFNTGLGGADRRPEPPPQGSRQQLEEQFLSNMFMYIGILILVWLFLF